MFYMCRTSFLILLLIKRGLGYSHIQLSLCSALCVMIHASTANNTQAAIRTNIAAPESVPQLTTNICNSCFLGSSHSQPLAYSSSYLSLSWPGICGAWSSGSYTVPRENNILMTTWVDRAKELDYYREWTNKYAFIDVVLAMSRTLMP